MSYKVNKIIYLLLGIVLGFFVGGGIIWWQLQENNLFDITNNDKNDLNDNTKQYDNTTDAKQKNKNKFPTAKFKIPDTFLDSLKMDSTTLTLEQLLALYNNVQKKDTSERSDASYDNIVISKDELIITRLIKISGEIPVKNNNYELDSILTDQRKTARKSNNIVKVEFWRSPLNYKGYKMDENKLIVFGLYEFNNVIVIGYNNELFIKYNKEYYLIENTDDFKSFAPLKNESLLKELNSI